MTDDPSSASQPSRRSVLGVLGAAPVAAGALLAASGTAAHADSDTDAGTSRSHRIPKELRPGGEYDQYIADLAEQDKFSGTVVVAYRGRTVLSRAYGMADKERSVPNRQDTAFALASASKPFTAVAVAQLAQQGKVAFHKTLGTYLDGFPAEIADTVTVYQLLTHTSGMGNHFDNQEFRDNFATWDSAAELYDGIMDITRKQPLAFTPGTKFGYSNSAMDVLGALVAKVSGQTFYDYIREHIFAPAGMTRSAYYTRPEWLTEEHIAHPYMLDTSDQRVDALHQPPVVKQKVPEGHPSGDEDGFAEIANVARAFIGTGAGNAFTTAQDMVRFTRALQHGKLLNRAYTELTLSGKVAMGPFTADPDATEVPYAHQAYGLLALILNDQRIFSHNGGSPGEATNFDAFPDLDWTVVVLSNYDTIEIQRLADLPRKYITEQAPEFMS